MVEVHVLFCIFDTGEIGFGCIAFPPMGRVEAVADIDSLDTAIILKADAEAVQYRCD